MEVCIFHTPPFIQTVFSPCTLTQMPLLLGGGSGVGNPFLEFKTLAPSELAELLCHHLSDGVSSEGSAGNHSALPSNPLKSKQAFLQAGHFFFTSIHFIDHHSFPGCTHFNRVIHKVKGCPPIPNCLLKFTPASSMMC